MTFYVKACMHIIITLYQKKDFFVLPSQHLQQAAMFPVCAIFGKPLLSQPGVTALGNLDTAIKLWKLMLPDAINQTWGGVCWIIFFN